MLDKKETPGQKLDREIAEEETRTAKMVALIKGFSTQDLKTLNRVTHVALYGDGEDD